MAILVLLLQRFKQIQVAVLLAAQLQRMEMLLMMEEAPYPQEDSILVRVQHTLTILNTR